MKEIAVMSLFSYDGMPSFGGTPMPFNEDTPFEMVSRLAERFSHRNHRLGSREEVLHHILRGMDVYSLRRLSSLKELVAKTAPTADEHLHGWRTCLKVFVGAYEGAGCIEWKAGIEHAKINPGKDYAIK